MINNFDQTVIESAVAATIRTLGVSEHVFNNRPRSSEKNLKDFVVCHVSGAIRDFGAYGVCTVSVSLFAQDVANMKNGKKLSVMQGKLKGGVPNEIDGLLLDFKGVEPVGDTADGFGYHVRIINLKQVIIKIV